MEVNNRVKKVIATMALIDDTQEQINRVKAEQDERVRAVKMEYDARIRQLRATLEEQHNLLSGICGPEYTTPRARSRSGSYGEATSDAQTLRARAVRYVGEQVLNPTPDEMDVESGQVLPEFD